MSNMVVEPDERKDPDMNKVPFVKGNQLIYNLGRMRSAKETFVEWWNRK